MTGLSILDLTPVRQGSDAASALRETLALAQLADAHGYQRYWLVEHHATAGVAGAATAVAIGHVAAHTKTIRVGAGGIMLPNHAPLMVAEQFGTLAAFHPGRIDLGLGRGINNDPATMQALRRQPGDAEAFAPDVKELLAYFDGSAPVKAVPGEGADVPVWILSSSLGGAQLAASLGLPYAFASHFAPDQLDVALAAYRGRFVPSARLAKPHVMLSLTAIVADTDTQAQMLFSSAQHASDGKLPPPVPDYLASIPAARADLLQRMFCHAAVGSPDTVAKALDAFRERYRPDEIIVTAQIYDLAARLKSFEMLAKIAA